MSYFSVAVNEVLDRLKTETGMTRLEYSKRIGMPNSSLASHAAGRYPDAEAMGQILSGMAEGDQRNLIIAHLRDETPEGWRSRIRCGEVPAQSLGPITFPTFADLPAQFRTDMEAIASEGQHNQQLIEFVREFVVLLKLEQPAVKAIPPQTWPSPKFQEQSVPSRGVPSTGQPSSSTPQSDRKAAEQADDYKAGSKGGKSGPRPKSTKPGIAKTKTTPKP